MVKLRSVDQGHLVFKRAIEPSLPEQASASEDSNSLFGDGFFSFANGESQSVSEAFPTATAEKPSSSSAAHSSSATKSSTASSTSSSPTSSSSSSSSTTTSSTSQSVSASSTDPLTPSASASAAAADDAQSSETLSGGAIAAIVAIVVIVVLGIVSYLIVRHRMKRKGMANNRLTRFSMGPTYNATSGMGAAAAPSPPQQQSFGYSTAMNNNPPPPMSSSTYPDPFQPSPHIQQQQPVYSSPMQQPYAAPIAESMMAAGTIAAAGSMQQPPQPPQQQQNNTMASMAGSNQPQPPIHTIVAGYTPALSDEIQVHPGDQVQIIAEYDDGWCLGMNLTTGQQQGVFPKHCFSPPEPPSQTAVAQQLTYPTPNFLGDPLSVTAAHQKRASSLYGPLQATPLH